MRALDELRRAGNSLFVVEHDLEMMRRADWLVDVGPDAGERGGRVLYSGPPAGLREVAASHTARYLFARAEPPPRPPRAPQGWLELRRHHPQQPARARCPLPARRDDRGDRRLRLGQVEPGQPGAGGAGLPRTSATSRTRPTRRPMPPSRRSPRKPHGRIAGGMERIAPAGARRPEADRPHAALQPRHLHRPLRRRAQAVRGDADGALAPLRRRAGSRSTSPRAAARPARARASSASSCCSCRACTRPAPPATARATTRRRWRCAGSDSNIAEVLRHDGRRRLRPSSPTSRRSLQAAGAAAGDRPRLPAPRPARDRAVRRRSAADQARDRAAAAAARRSLYVLDEPTTGLHPADVDKLMAQLAGAGRCRQHGDRGRARDARGRRLRLGGRHRPRRGERRRADRRRRTAPSIAARGARRRRPRGARPYLAAFATAAACRLRLRGLRRLGASELRPRPWAFGGFRLRRLAPSAACSSDAFARFCFWRRMPRSLSALMLIPVSEEGDSRPVGSDRVGTAGVLRISRVTPAPARVSK